MQAPVSCRGAHLEASSQWGPFLRAAVGSCILFLGPAGGEAARSVGAAPGLEQKALEGVKASGTLWWGQQEEPAAPGALSPAATPS